jgi:hypothetical protein
MKSHRRDTKKPVVVGVEVILKEWGHSSLFGKTQRQSEGHSRIDNLPRHSIPSTTTTLVKENITVKKIYDQRTRSDRWHKSQLRPPKI